MRGLHARGHANVLFTPPASELSRRASDAGVARVVEIPMRSEFDLPSVVRVAAHLSASRADVMQFHDARAVTIGGLAGTMAGFRNRFASRRLDYRLRSVWKWRYLADAVIAVSRAVGEIVVADGIPADRVRVVYDAVDPSRVEGGDREATRKALGLAEDACVFLCPGAFTGQKGHDFLLGAMAAVTTAVPAARLLLAGKGELEEEMRRLARSLGLRCDAEDRDAPVRFLGWRDDVNDLLAASDVFVMASRNEGLCSASLEAMWVGLPVVATRAGGLPEAVGEAGCLVPVGDVDSLAREMIRLARDPEERARLSKAGHRRARRLFSADAMVNGTLAVYEELRRKTR